MGIIAIQVLIVWIVLIVFMIGMFISRKKFPKEPVSEKYKKILGIK